MRLGSVRSNLLKKSIKKTIVEPGESSSKLLFIPASSIKDGAMIQIPIQNLKRLLYLDLKLNLFHHETIFSNILKSLNK